MRVQYAEIAIEDFLALAEYLGIRAPGFDEKFLLALRETSDLLAEKPSVGSPVRFESPALPDLRFFPIHGFSNHLIFYRPAADGIEVIRVLHGARDLLALFS